MTDTQVTLIQLDNYGPWTVTPHPRPEPDLQALQADLYADVARFVGARDGYVFPTRYDNVVAVTNGVDRAAHERLQETVRNRYPVTVSLGVGAHETPAGALSAASEALQGAGSAQAADRAEALRWAGGVDTADPEALCVAHFDVVDATGSLTDRVDAYDAFHSIQRGTLELADALRERDALAFFVGGDNVIAVAPTLDRGEYEAVLDRVADRTGLEFRVGVGTGSTAVDAGMDAKEALETCRARDLAVAGTVGHPVEHAEG